jgi:WD40 repeat protein
VNVWDIENTEFYTLQASGNTRQALEVAMTPDGRRAVTVSRHERTVRLWDLERRIELQQFSLTGESYGSLGVAISADGRRAAFISGVCVTTWDIDGSTELGRSRLNLGRNDYVDSIAMDPSGDHVIVAAPEGLTFFDAQTHQAKRVLDDSASLRRFALSKEAGLIVGVRNTELIFWRTGHDSHPVVVDLGQRVDACDCTPDGRFVAALVEEKVIRVWDVSRNKLLASFTADYALRFCAIAAAGDFVVAAAISGVLYRLSLRK